MQHMKKLATIVFIILVCASCKKSNTDTATGEKILKEGDCLQNIKGKGITICFDNLEQDSRCPANVMCIWRGIAVANFTLKNNQGEIKFKLADYKFVSYNNDTTINDVHIILKNITPYPGEVFYSTKNKTAILEIQ